MATNFHHEDFRTRGAFTLIELLVVMAVIGLLMVVGAGMFRSKDRARRAAADAVTGMVDQARNTAIRTRRHVLLAIAGPKELPDSGDGASRCRIGLFELRAAPEEDGQVLGRLLERWRPLPKGIVAMGGQADGLRNVLDTGFLLVRYETAGKGEKTRMPGLVFTPRGGLAWPRGSDPVAIRLAEGAYIDGTPTRTRKDGRSDEIIRIGRVVARPWRAGP